MKLRRALPALILPFALSAQTAVLRTLMDRDQIEAPATLCVIDAMGSHALADGFTSLLQQEELKVFQVPQRSYALGSGAERSLMESQRLPAKAQWVLLDRKGAIRARGEALPTSSAFAHELEQAGFHDRVKELRAYLKINPRVLEAHEQLLLLLRRRAEATAQRIMGVQVPSRRESLDRGDLTGFLTSQIAPAKADLSAAKTLDAVQDLEAWGAFAQELDTVFRSGQWQELDQGWLREARPLDEASPTLTGLYQRWLPTVEAALRQAPSSNVLWRQWLWMSRSRDGKALRPLLASLHPSPLEDASAWPPPSVMRALFSTAQSPEDWRALKDYFQARWTGHFHFISYNPSGLPPDALAVALLERDWKASLEPLIESSLRCGETQQADALLIESLDASHWAGLASKASAVAARCGLPTLAARWASLRPGGPRR